MQWYLNSRFGMFIHWGLYSQLARGEWIMHVENIPIPDYAQLANSFNPVHFNADEWVSLAADAGQKWITITSRHHDGFSMYDTALSDYKITRSPFGRDPLAELANACAHRGDVQLGFYSSLLDWHHPAYFDRTNGRPPTQSMWSEYTGFLHGQVRELCTRYGHVAQMWFDGDWPAATNPHPPHFNPGGSFDYPALYGMIHELQPHCIIHNNRHAEPLPGEDVQGIEQDLPGENTTGFNPTKLYDLPIEVCMTMNDNWWGNDARDRSMKSVRRLVHVLTRLAAAGQNFLLNAGPQADGRMQPLQAERLRGVGAWLRANGASIYDTQPGAFGVTADLASTRRGRTHYIHSLNYNSDVVDLPHNATTSPHAFASARLLATRHPIDLERTNIWGRERLRLHIPPALRDPHNTVIVLEEAA